MATPFSAAPSAATEHAGKVPVIEIAFKHGMWWALPEETSQELYDKHLANEEDIEYVWNLGRLTVWVVEA